MEILINGANLLYVAAYFTTDLLRLRILTMIAAACLATYFACQPVPLVNVVAWNLFFFALNAMQLVRIVMERRAVLRFSGRWSLNWQPSERRRATR